jgi:hypothetical protein
VQPLPEARRQNHRRPHEARPPANRQRRHGQPALHRRRPRPPPSRSADRLLPHSRPPTVPRLPQAVRPRRPPPPAVIVRPEALSALQRKFSLIRTGPASRDPLGPERQPAPSQTPLPKQPRIGPHRQNPQQPLMQDQRARHPPKPPPAQPPAGKHGARPLQAEPLPPAAAQYRPPQALKPKLKAQSPKPILPLAPAPAETLPPHDRTYRQPKRNWKPTPLSPPKLTRKSPS